jgi:hypothetical protein
MKLRPTVALVLVGWYLMISLAMLGKPEEWIQVGTDDSTVRCGQDWTGDSRHDEDAGPIF